jgi:uncharacterized protein YoxC
MKNTTKVLLGFAAGIAAAAGLYALSKTEKGQEVLHDLGKKVDHLKKDVDGLVEKGKHLADDLAKKFNGAVKEAKEPVA